MLNHPLQGKKVVVLGLGRSGMATLSWLLDRGALPIGVDHNPHNQQDALKRGALIESDPPLEGVYAVVQSPGISPSHPLTQKARQRGVLVITDVDLFRQENPNALFIGVTGTNGKSTTTALIGHILQSCDRDVAIGGNIGVPVLSLPPSKGIYVLEMSSYQLELSQNLDFQYVAWLNITPDHLDRHGSMNEYVKAKENIFQYKNDPPKVVIGIDDPFSQSIYEKYHQIFPRNILPVSCHRQIEEGVWVHESSLFDKKEYLSSLKEYHRLQGVHNHQNIAISWGICQNLGLSLEEIRGGIRSFQGLAHRQEQVVSFGGIDFINDSKATNADATLKALTVYETIYWIAGGIPKKEGIVPLKPFFHRVREVFLFGASREEFAKTIGDDIVSHLCDTMEEAVFLAFKRAQQAGEKATLLFSPACASFDQFKDFEHRGDTFKQSVHKLIQERVL